jgi:hypothetical protein
MCISFCCEPLSVLALGSGYGEIARPITPSLLCFGALIVSIHFAGDKCVSARFDPD